MAQNQNNADLSQEINFALGVHMHLPPCACKRTNRANREIIEKILKNYYKIAEYARYSNNDIVFHVGISGSLLDQLNDPRVIDDFRNSVDIPLMLELLRTAKNIEFIGMGYHHPIFPLIPEQNWNDHIKRGKDRIQNTFNATPKGFWPSQLAFTMKMIPAIAEAGYEYVIVDRTLVTAIDIDESGILFSPFKSPVYNHQLLKFVPRYHPSWMLYGEVGSAAFLLKTILTKTEGKSKKSERPFLATIWFQDFSFCSIYKSCVINLELFEPFVRELLSLDRGNPLINLSGYLKNYDNLQRAIVSTGAWEKALNLSKDFSPWNSSVEQKQAIEAMADAGEKYVTLKNSKLSKEKMQQVADAKNLLLEAQTSCYLCGRQISSEILYEKLSAANGLMMV